MKGKEVKRSKERYFELGNVPIGIGAVIKGWNITEERYKNNNLFSVVNFRAMTEACPHECAHCFTDKKKRTLSFDEIKIIIDKLAEMGTYTIDFVGEGEPSIDPYFFDIVEYTISKGINVIVYSDVATKMNDPKFVEKLYKLGASVSPKCDSLFDEEYQNSVVQDKTNLFFKKRNEAIELLIEKGFNKISEDGTTRMGFDMVVSRKNMHDVEKTLHFYRKNNLWIIFSFFLTAGRSAEEDFDHSLELSAKEKIEMIEKIQKIDEEYGLYHKKWNNLITTRCIEFIHIYGDGRVSPCPGNEEVFGNVLTDSLKDIQDRILLKYPNLNKENFDGFCPYRERLF